MMDKFIAHYWTSHCEHCVGFDTIDEACNFLRAGLRAHNMAVDRITTADGAVVMSREELLGSPPRPACRWPADADLARSRVTEPG